MKKRIVLGSMILAAASGASAQTSVTMFGIVDAGINFTKFGSSKATRISDGGNAASRIGFRGNEDLGGGMRALFLIEAGVNADDGLGILPGPGLAFTRQAYMGLGGNWGQLTMGRHYTPSFIASAGHDPFSANALFGSVNLWYQAADQTGYTAFVVRQNNSLIYNSPANIPWKLNVMYGAGEADQPSTSSGRVIDITGGYQGGPLSVLLSRQERKSGTAAAPVASPTSSTSQGIWANYTIGPARLGFNYGTAKVDVAGSAQAKYMGVNGRYTMGSWAFLAHYQKRDVASTSNDQTSFTLGVDYSLSTRTSLYGRMLQFKNSGTALVRAGGYPFAANSATVTTGTSGVLPGDDGRSIMFGVRHNF